MLFSGFSSPLTQKFSKIPQLLGLCPRPHSTLLISFLKNGWCIKLYFEFDCLDCFSPIFASPTEKLFNFCSPKRKILPVPMGGRTAILPPQKVLRCLMPPYHPHFCRPSWLPPGAVLPFRPLIRHCLIVLYVSGCLCVCGRSFAFQTTCARAITGNPCVLVLDG